MDCPRVRPVIVAVRRRFTVYKALGDDPFAVPVGGAPWSNSRQGTTLKRGAEPSFD
jgi:hypothetical protein